MAHEGDSESDGHTLANGLRAPRPDGPCSGAVRDEIGRGLEECASGNHVLGESADSVLVRRFHDH